MRVKMNDLKEAKKLFYWSKNTSGTKVPAYHGEPWYKHADSQDLLEQALGVCQMAARSVVLVQGAKSLEAGLRHATSELPGGDRLWREAIKAGVMEAVHGTASIQRRFIVVEYPEGQIVLQTGDLQRAIREATCPRRGAGKIRAVHLSDGRVQARVLRELERRGMLRDRYEILAEYR